MAGFNTIDTTGFDAAIASFKEAQNAYNNARQILANRTSALANDWTGKGGSKYKSVSRKMFNLLEDDGESLNYIIENLETIRAAYTEMDSKLAKEIEKQEVNAGA